MDEELRRALDGMLAEIRQLRTDMMARLDRHENRLTAIRDDIGVNMAATHRVREANDGTRNELRALGEQVTVMERQIQRLQTQMRDLRGEP